MGLALAEAPAADRPGEVMPLRRWDVTHLDLKVVLDPKKRSLTGVTEHHIEPLVDHQVFRLHQRALDITSVAVDGEAVEVRRGEDWIDVPVTPGKPHVVRVEYGATPQRGLFFRSKRDGYNVTEVWTQGEGEDNRYWFPSWDYPNDLFTVTTEVVAPEHLVVRGNGAQVGKQPQGDQTLWTFELEQPIVNYLVAIVAGEYRVITDDSGRVPTEILGPRTESEKVLSFGASKVAEMMPFYEELLGEPYPYPVYRQIFVQGFLYGGMENATVTTITDERLVDAGSEARVSRLDSVVAHELAHHWFGDLLTCYGWRELWLNEGFATFYEQRWKEKAYGPEYAAAARFRSRQGARRGDRPMAARAHTKVAGHDNDRVYVRGSSVLHALRVHFGDAVYDAAIKDWVAANRHRLVESEDLRRVFEDHTGEHLGWLWDGWVYGGGQPTWKVGWTYEDGQLTVDLDAEHEGVFHTPVEIEIGSDPVRTEKIWLDGRPGKLVVALDQAPRWVAVDPRGGVIGTFETDQPVDAWLAQLADSPTPLARLDAMEALGPKGEDRVSEALASIASSGLDGYFRNFAVQALTKQGTDVARDALIDRLANDGNAYIREAAAKGLKEYDGKEVERALTRAQAVDTDPGTRAEALTSLDHVLGEDGLSRLRARLRQPDRSRQGSEHIAALERLEERGELEDARAALRFLGPEHPRWVRVTAMDTITGLLREADEDQRTSLQRTFIRKIAPLLEHVDVRIRQGVIRSFSAAHADDIDILRRFVRTTEVPGERERAQKVIDAHGEPKPPKSDEALEERLKKLESGQEKHDERLEALETWRI